MARSRSHYPAGGFKGLTYRDLEPPVDMEASKRGHQENILLESIDDPLLKGIMEGLPRRVDDFLLSRMMEVFPQEGHAARGDRDGCRPAIQQAEDEARGPVAGQKGWRQCVPRQHEW